MYRIENDLLKKRIQEEKMSILRISALAAVLVLIVEILDWIALDGYLSAVLFWAVFISLFGLTAGLSFAVCCMVRIFRKLPFIRTALAAIFCMAFPVILFTFGILCFVLGIGPVPN